MLPAFASGGARYPVFAWFVALAVSIRYTLLSPAGYDEQRMKGKLLSLS